MVLFDLEFERAERNEALEYEKRVTPSKILPYKTK